MADDQVSSESQPQEGMDAQIEHLTTSANQVAWSSSRQFLFQTALFIQSLWNLVSHVFETTKTVSVSVVRGLQAKNYVFFQGSTYPYRQQEYSLTGPGVPPIEWYYNADTKLFLSSSLVATTDEYQRHHMPWLSGQIRYNDLVLYDITEFLEELYWAGTTRPSPAHVLAAWSLDSGIVIQNTNKITIQTINEDGTESTLSICGQAT